MPPRQRPHTKRNITCISLSSINNISFMPTCMLQISEKNIFKKSIQSHNKYLSKFATLPQYGTSPEINVNNPQNNPRITKDQTNSKNKIVRHKRKMAN
mmetsp:Transcript_25714/g.29661  ORF Transcript_25714/g.29661 Transcript_25714/m.29661 type:complete len:98 (-) Transcript_25714:35-328(-)